MTDGWKAVAGFLIFAEMVVSAAYLIAAFGG